MISSVMGRKSAPVWIGEYPRMCCRKSELKKKMPNMASVTSPIAAFAPAKVAFLKSERSSIGMRWCSSSRTNAARAAAATANSARILADVQPYVFASISA
jgi:hypothetical protein